MSKYIRMHQVEAEPMTRGEYNKKRGWQIPANENPDDEGYLITYPDGYVSWCPKEKFEKDSFSIDGEQGAPNAELTFSALKTYHDRYYATPRGEKDSLSDRLIRAYYNEFVGRPNGCLTFGMAIEAMKSGKKVCRKGWNGKGMYIWLMPGSTVKGCKNIVDPHLADIDKAEGEIRFLGSIRMYTHDSTGRKAVLTGWLASQSDILCEDWMIVE